MLKGYTPESSGGLLVVMERGASEEYVKEMREVHGRPAWVVGRVVEGSREVQYDVQRMEIVSAESLTKFRSAL